MKKAQLVVVSLLTLLTNVVFAEDKPKPKPKDDAIAAETERLRNINNLVNPKDSDNHKKVEKSLDRIDQSNKAPAPKPTPKK